MKTPVEQTKVQDSFEQFNLTPGQYFETQTSCSTFRILANIFLSITGKTKNCFRYENARSRKAARLL